jgi:hypothetical protein
MAYWSYCDVSRWPCPAEHQLLAHTPTVSDLFSMGLSGTTLISSWVMAICVAVLLMVLGAGFMFFFAVVISDWCSRERR